MAMIEMFSTHAKINDSNGHLISWIPDRELEVNMIALLQSDPNSNEESWAQYFVSNFDTNLLASKHISAYLERVAVNAAQRVHRRLRNFQQYTQHQYEIFDVLQIGLLITCTPQRFFKTFNQKRPLKNFVHTTMERKIDEILCQQMGQKRLSDWGLLRYTTQKLLQEALHDQGYRQPQHLLAYKCFRAIYAPQKTTGQRSLQPPTDKQLQEMANLYNMKASDSTADQTHIHQLLSECVQALRKYQKIRIDSIDVSGYREGYSPHLSDIDPLCGFQEGSLIIKERILLSSQLMDSLSKFLQQIDQSTDNYLLLRYGVQAVYASIARIFNVDGTTIYRRCRLGKRTLLSQVAEWANVQLHITASSEMIEEMNALLDECLIHYYQDLTFRLVFKQAWQQLGQQRQILLRLRYFWLKNEAAIAHELQLDESQVRSGLESGTQELAAVLRNWIQQRLTVPSNLLNPLAEEILDFVKTLTAKYTTP
ncbi:MAG: hypothetical protein DSM106950_39490 [Stigonema ocellatum SAG 48.90 = DSM 106950]|nr:hypothetical protein [Stigonema ocellatum SAG 48.90 = DSM 106950]